MSRAAGPASRWPLLAAGRAWPAGSCPTQLACCTCTFLWGYLQSPRPLGRFPESGRRDIT